MEKTNGIFPAMTERELNGARLSRSAAAQGMVLLKNNNRTLPLSRGRVALFGNGAARTVRGGTGSGDPFNGGLSGGGDKNVDLSPRYHINILAALEAEGFDIVNTAQLNAYAALYDEAKLNFKGSFMDTFAFPEEALTADILSAYAAETDTAVCVISRNAGEGADRSLTKTATVNGIAHEVGDYNLCAVELENLALLRAAFKKLILVLNVGGAIAAGDLLRFDPDAILLMGQGGQEGGAALADVLTGRENPSGKLTATWALRYDDYPAAKDFLADPATALYTEGVYVGYRYFDTFGVECGFPFGFGLSYTDFSVSNLTAELNGEDIRITADVTNIGTVSGREVVQVYASAPANVADMPAKELRGFAKTSLLAAGESETLTIDIPLRRLASYDEPRGGYMLYAGDYAICAGVSSCSTSPVCRVRIAEDTCTELVLTELPLVHELEELKAAPRTELSAEWQSTPILTPAPLETVDRRSPYADQSVTTYTTDPAYTAVMPYEKVQLVEKRTLTFEDVRAGRATPEEFAAQLSVEELAVFCCGTGWGIQDDVNPVIGASSESVPGAAGETTHALENLGVPSMVVADGPAGLRITQCFEATELATGLKKTVYHHCIAWPVGTVLAQTFDTALLEEVGRGIAADMAAFGIAIILGPGMNIHRDPLCGRNFEYFSEDPLLTGCMSAAIVRGVQSIPGSGACIKHYAANNQETNRNTVDSVLSQRALREIYLAPFRIAVEDAHPVSIMTSYNLINGTPTADSYDLCTNLARGEWGFDGLIMTDWNGGSSTPWKSMHAGNDLIMPGGAANAMIIRKAVESVAPEFDDRGQVSSSRIVPFMPVVNTHWHSFNLSADGTDYITAPIAEGHTASLDGDVLLVDGEPLYTEAATRYEMRADPASFVPLRTPATTAVAAFAPDGRSVTYRGTYSAEPKICLGDVQKSAAAIMRVILGVRTSPIGRR